MAAPRRITTRDFLQHVRDLTLARLGQTFGPPQARIVFSSLQIHFGLSHLHYEVWPVRKTGRIEIGLHLEGPQEWSRALAALLAAHADDLRAALGPEYELEDWTASWCRLHRTLPLQGLSQPLAEEVADCLSHLVRAVEPLLRDLAPDPPPSSAPGAARPRYRRRRATARR